MINQGNQYEPGKGPEGSGFFPKGQDSTGIPTGATQPLGDYEPQGGPQHQNDDGRADHASDADEALANFRAVGDSQVISSTRNRDGSPADLPQNGYSSPANLEIFGASNGREDK